MWKKDSVYQNCCIFWPAFGCCAPQMLVEIVIFSIFYAKTLKKVTNLLQIFSKKWFFKVCTKALVECFIPNFNKFFSLSEVKVRENDYFDKCLVCSAPRHWLKYTTLYFRSVAWLHYSTEEVYNKLSSRFGHKNPDFS